nr:hypothetical protein Saspl_034285 [Ipomoea trifida]GMC50423.1 exocyst complex component SEC3A-like [Ipomoea batatas]
MAKCSADDQELRRACQLAIEATKQKVVMSMRVAKSHGSWGKPGKIGRGQMAKPRVLAISTKQKGQRTKAFLRVLKYSSGGVLEGFDKIRNATVAPPQWTMRNVDDRNRFLLCILNICKDILGHLPKVVGIDVVEMALWAKENTPVINKQQGGKVQDGPMMVVEEEADMTVTVERELVSQAEEEDMEALLGTYVMGIGEAEAFSERLKRELQALEAANVHTLLENEPLVNQVLQGLESASNCVEDMDEWLAIFNIEARNNKLEMQSVNNRKLIEDLDRLVEKFCIPAEHASYLTGDSFDEACMHRNVEACEWLTGAIVRLDSPNLDSTYSNMRAVKEKRAELRILKMNFARRATDFLNQYFSSLVDFMMNDKNYFSQRGQLKRPDHSDLRYKCRTYARLLQHLKVLDKTGLGSLRKAYCASLNLLLRRETREFSNELRTSTKAPKAPTAWLEGSAASTQSLTSVDTSAVSEAYSKMLTVFVPLLVDEEDFHAVVDWAHKIDPLRCISMHGVTERYISGQKSDTAGFVRILLDDLESKISVLFSRFVDEACHQIERNERNVRQVGVLLYIPRFAALATRMEQYIQGQSRDLVDQAYTKLVTMMFVSLEKIAQADPKYEDIMLLENYAAFQNSLYDLANVVSTLAKFYHQASEAYEQACTRHISMIIYYHFERLFEFARRIEESMYNLTPEEIPFQIGLSKADLRKVVKSSLSGVDKSIAAMYKRLQKNLTSEELFPSLWDKLKKDFLDKYDSFYQLVAKVYPSENIPSVSEIEHFCK